MRFAWQLLLQNLYSFSLTPLACGFTLRSQKVKMKVRAAMQKSSTCMRCLEADAVITFGFPAMACDT